MKAWHDKCAKLFLSTFSTTHRGRGFASAGYGISKLLYHAEFEDMPASVVADINTVTTKLVEPPTALTL